MTQLWNAGGDFAKVVDTLESLTIRRVGCVASLSTSGWRYSESTTQLAGFGGAVTATETIWQVPATSASLDPSVGDRVIDADSTCSTIIEVDPQRGATRKRLTSRRISIRHRDADWYDLEEPVWDTQQSPHAVVGWRMKRAAIRGLDRRSSTDAGSVPSETLEGRRLLLTEPVEASANDRFRSRSGRLLVVTPQAITNELGRGWVYDVVEPSILS